MQKIKVAAYCRVSTDTKDQENSFINQKTYFEREIAKNPNYELYEIYADKGISGTSLSRDEFNRMLYDAGLDLVEVRNENDNKTRKVKETFIANTEREPKFNLIMVKNTSRFARNVLVTDIIRELKKKGVYIHFLDINKTTANEADEMLLQMLFILDENESRDKSRKVRFGHMESARKGVIFTNTTIYGYKYIPETNELEIIPEEAEVIRLIYDLYVNKGYGIRRIINYLTEHGIYTRQGKEFTKSTIKRILTNEKYCGILVRNKYTTGVIFQNKHYPKIKDESEWIIHEDKIPAIISRELFEEAQKILKSKVNYQNQKGINKGYTPYVGLLYCAKCGNTYVANIDRGRRFYVCGLKKRKGVKFCDNHNISLEYLEEYLKREYENYISRLDAKFEDVLLYLDYFIKKRINKDDIDLNSIEKQLQTLEEEEKKLVDLYLSDLITKTVYEEKYNAILQKRDTLSALKNEAENKEQAYKALDEKIRRFINMFTNEIETLKKEEDIKKYIKKITVHPNKILEIEWKLLDIDEELKKLGFNEEDFREVKKISDALGFIDIQIEENFLEKNA